MTSELVKVLDGGLAMQLSKHAGENVDGDPLWISKFLVTNTDAVYKMHLDFLRAGSQIIETATYQASIPGYVKHMNKTEQEARQILLNAVELCKKAVSAYKEEIKDHEVSNPAPLIAGSAGPYGAGLNDGSEYTAAGYKNLESMDPVIEWHKKKIETLIEGGVDLLAMETIPSCKEAEAVVNLLKQYPDVKAWISFSCKEDGKSIADGTSFKEAVLQCRKIAAPGQIIAYGLNCLAPQSVTPLLQSISEKEIGEFIPMVVYANSGERYSTEKSTWIMEEDSHRPHEFAKEWLDLGVRYIGGCCRTDSTDVERIAAAVKSWNKNHTLL